MLRDPSDGETDPELPVTPPPTPARDWLDHARRVIAEASQPYDFYNLDGRPDILGFEKPPELLAIWQPPTWNAIILPTDVLAHRIPFMSTQPTVWALRDRNTGAVWQAPSEPDAPPRPLILPSLGACMQWVELLSGQITEIWLEGVSPNEQRMFGPHVATFRPRSRIYGLRYCRRPDPPSSSSSSP